ncbi:Restriction endonuclease S [Myroides sp. A21]|uniref:restriction endonuclease subunit S n=1 Tax=Myroides sp. A21 TaxID=1583100 RepID=UPI000585C63A|nr:restriction endonuclease subunit S [Myroides sp. A21]AJA69886.1 Restriction endonuclease S [Myroides sp. A21]
MVREGYKQTEIGVIPVEWEVKEFKEIVHRIGDGIHSTPNYSDNEEYYFINGNNFSDGVIKINTETKTVSKDEFKLHKRDLGNNTILLSINGTIGNLALYKNEKVVLGKSACYINVKNENSKYYVYYCLQSNNVKTYFEDNLTGTTIKNLGLKTIGSTSILLPPLKEQEAIAEALSDTDEWINSLEELIAKKRLIKQGAMQELLTPKEGWEVKKLGDVCDVRGGGTPSTFTSEYWNGNIIWFTPTEVGIDKYLYNSNRKITELGLKNCSANILPVNSILLTTRAGIGDVGILKIEACTNQGFQSLVCKENVYYEFVYYMMQTKKSELLNNASGSTFLEISPNKIKAISFNIPSLPEQERIATILSDMDREIALLEEQLAKAKQIKQGMMQELLTGRVRLVPTN